MRWGCALGDAKAVVDLLTAPVFNALGYSESDVPYEDELKGKVIKDMLIGDRAYFRNYSDYKEKFPNGAYYAENVIKFDETMFWGHPDGRKTEVDWYETLKNVYNAPNGKPEGKQRTEQVPGFDGNLQFLNVVKIAKDAFLYRRTEQSKQRKKVRRKR